MKTLSDEQTAQNTTVFYFCGTEQAALCHRHVISRKHHGDKSSRGFFYYMGFCWRHTRHLIVIYQLL